ncbi:hypothetical protein Gpo141_00013490 [Globisporangium polare]
MGFVKGCMRKAYVAWIDWQVELHGQYSFERLRNLQAHAWKTPILRALTIALLTPIPCLVLITLIDCVPLASPAAGTNANYVHWIRNYLTIVFMTYAFLEQFRYTVPGLPLDAIRCNVVANLATLGGVAFQFLMSHVIGFPLPFSIVVGTPIWAIVIVTLFRYYFARLIRENTQFRIDLANAMGVFLCQITLTVVYPAYVYGFQSIHPDSQKFYVVLLPLLKIFLKNWMSRFLGELDDLKSEIVIFNVDVFNAFYVSCCMQRSSSISTTLVVSLADWATAYSSLRDITLIHDEVKKFLDLIPRGHAWHGLSFLAVAEKIIQEDAFIQGHPSLRAKCKHSGELMFTVASKKARSVATRREYPQSVVVVPVAGSLISGPDSKQADSAKSSVPSGDLNSKLNLTPATGIPTKYLPPLEKPRASSQETRGCSLYNEEERLHFVQNVLKLLFTTEFVILLEYTVVAAPVIYSIYIAAVYHLKNRMYYAQLAHLEQQDLERTISNVMVYACLQFVVIIAMGFTLKKRLGVSVFKQVSFVLVNQWTLVHSKVILWFFYCVQNSLDHFGADYSFKFQWLSSSTQSAPTSPPLS